MREKEAVIWEVMHAPGILLSDMPLQIVHCAVVADAHQILFGCRELIEKCRPNFSAQFRTV